MSNLDQAPRDNNGKRHGLCLYYYYSGKLMCRCNFVHGIEHGLDEGYYEDNKLRYCGYRNMGRKVGYWYWFNQKRYYLWLI